MTEHAQIRADLARHEAGYPWGTKCEHVAELLSDRDRLTRELAQAKAALVAMTRYRDGGLVIQRQLEAEVERLRADLAAMRHEILARYPDISDALARAAEQHGREEGK